MYIYIKLYTVCRLVYSHCATVDTTRPKTLAMPFALEKQTLAMLGESVNEPVGVGESVNEPVSVMNE